MEIQLLPVSSVFPSPMNPRKTFDEEDMQELADNIERQGLLQPITVRPIKDKVGFAERAKIAIPVSEEPIYEIICGERRYRAFSMLHEKWSSMDQVAPKGYSYSRYSLISAIVREMDDEEAFDAMITENLQRKDVDPIEEAFAFGQLAKSGKTAEEIAARFGKSVRFVTERIKLNTLIPELMLAVKEERMPITAAQIICKLDAEDQRKFYSRNEVGQSFSRSSAEGFTRNLFMEIGGAAWNDDKGFPEPGYAGGCGIRCSECEFNTTNHGCLFYEMKSNDSGRCTNRDKFNLKARSFVLDKVAERSAELVRKGEPLEYGKAVLAIEVNDYDRGDALEVKKNMIAELESLGYEIVNPGKVFKSKCWYAADDERTVAMTASGELYRVMNLFNYSGPVFREEYWYIKGVVKDESNGSVVVGDALPVEVSDILGKLKSKESSLASSLAVAATKALDSCVPSDEPLTDDEMTLLVSCMLVNNPHVCDKIGIPDWHYPEKIRDYVAEHPEMHNRAMHAWLHHHIDLADPCRRIAEPLLEDLGRLHCPEEYAKAIEKTQSKHDKEVEKLAKRLRELGYDTDGRKLTEPSPKTGKEPIKGYSECREKYPDALLLFRVGDFYECFNEDAVKASEVLGLTLTGTSGCQLCGFPDHALDTYLPKLIRAGVRVAIDERQNENKPKKKD